MTTQKINNSNPYDNGSAILQPARVFSGNLKSLTSQFSTAIRAVDTDEYAERTVSTTKSSTGFSQSIFANRDCSLVVTAAGWGGVTVQVSGDNSTWIDLESPTGVVTATSNKAIQVYGGLYYRLNVTSYTNPITITLYGLLK